MGRGAESRVGSRWSGAGVAGKGQTRGKAARWRGKQHMRDAEKGKKGAELMGARRAKSGG